MDFTPDYSEQITAILAIVEAYLRTYKIPTDHDKQEY